MEAEVSLALANATQFDSRRRVVNYRKHLPPGGASDESESGICSTAVVAARVIPFCPLPPGHGVAER